MPFIEGYTVKEPLYQGAHYTIYRAERNADHQKVILKTCRFEQPSVAELAGLQHEYQVLKHLTLAGVVKPYDLVRHQQQLTLVLEDIEGCSLHQYLADHPLSLPYFFQIGLQLVDALAGLHAQHLIHKDLNSHNIIIHPESLTIKLIDFTLSSQLTEETTEHLLLDKLEGHLGYFSPEQTGRMNRPIDYRSDFYSLGVIFFEMLTGRLPFNSKDPLDIIHQHIAQSPPAVSTLNAAIPAQLAAIVTKLLAKIPEDRYASAAGLKADLTECQLQWQTKQQIGSFPLGRYDVHDRLSLSHKLYGREEQVQQLLTTFERVAQGTTELLLVTGYSGIGKSSVVKEIHKPIVQHKAHFIKGKCDQLQHATPYSALVAAFQELIKQLLCESEERLHQLKRKLLAALGNNGQVIVDILPTIDLLIGQQPTIQELPPMESQTRFMLTFQSLVRTLAEPEHPLVIFLDDLQWIDSNSLQLLHLLLSDPDTKHLLIIGAYRNHEVSIDHPLALALQKLKEMQAKITEVTLTPLSLSHIQQFLADSLNSNINRVESLAQLLLEKTLGNPFFIIVFLQRLYQDKLLEFSYSSLRWEWDINRIKQADFTDNVVDLLVSRMRQLPASVQTCLKLASCLGHLFELKTLSIISELPTVTLANALGAAIEAGLIVSTEARHGIVLLLKDPVLTEKLDLATLYYRFVHDRVQQAAYQLIPENEQSSVHLRIGRLLRECLPLDEEAEGLFEIVDHFNKSIALITNPAERLQLANYNLWAGRKAKKCNAYWVAEGYLSAGLDLLKPFDWKQQHDLIFILYHELATCHYLTAKHEDAQKIFAELLQRTSDKINKLNIYKSMCEMLATLNQHQQAIALGMDALKLVGLPFPKKARRWHILLAILNIQWKIAGKLPHLMLPPMENPLYQAVTALLAQLLNSAFFTDHNLHALLLCRHIQLDLRYGYTDSSAFAIPSYGLILIHALNWYKQGMAVVEWQAHLKQRYGTTSSEAKSLLALGVFIDIWRCPLIQTKETLRQAYQLAYETGDLVYANYCNIVLFTHTFMLGSSLSDCEQALERVLHFAEKTKTSETIIGPPTVLACLLGQKSVDPEEMATEEKMLVGRPLTNSNYFYSAWAKLHFLFNNYQQAAEAGAKHWHYAEYGLGSYSNPEGYFYYALTLMARHNLTRSDLKFVKKIHQIFKRWASWCPENYLDYLLLIEAEMARIKNDILSAMRLYEQAIQKAHEQHALSIVGIAYECAARFYHQLGNALVAKTCIQSAYYAYQQWGAIGKCQALVKAHPEWLQNLSLPSTLPNNLNTSPEHSNVDILSILKFTQVLSGEIQLENLLQKLLTVLLQNAGAQRIVLLIKTDNQWYVEAEGTHAELKVHLVNKQAMEERTDLPLQLLHYAQRAQELVLLQEAKAREEKMITDNYLDQTNPQSILILPIFHQGQFKSLLYLENRITSHAFSPDRIQTLKLLAAQAAISLENARLYYQVTHDPLTGLANRNLLYQIFSLTTHKAQRNRDKIALLFMDLDGFKHINDTMGHEVGDKLLQYFANALKVCLRRSDLAVRLGGDEFLIMLEGVDDLARVTTVADRLLQSLKEPALIEGHQILINTSIGISLYPENGEDIQTLLKQADIALYRVKSQGKGHYQFYTQTINKQLEQENQQERELRQALKEQQFCMYYQPVYSAKNGELDHFEALVRWQHPIRQLLPAGEFISLAEKTGLIVQLGEWVFYQVARQIKVWRSLGLSPVRVAVNVSGLQLKKQAISQLIEKILKETQIGPEYLEVELTESSFIEQTDQVVNDLKTLQQMGIHLTVDDFGTYYASLSYLRRFAVNSIKIDHTFVNGIVDSKGDHSLIHGIVALAHHLDLNVVAEGVETEQQASFLKESGVDALQGYYLGRPMDSEACAQLLARRKGSS